MVPTTLKAVRVLFLIGAILVTVGVCGLLMMSMGEVGGWSDPMMGPMLAMFVVNLVMAWVCVVLAFRACDGSNRARWALVVICYLGIVADVVMIFAGLGSLPVFGNLAMQVLYVWLLQFSLSTNEYFREIALAGRESSSM